MALPLSSNDHQATPPGSKPTVYLLESFHPDVMAFCNANFNVIARDNNPEQLAQWRENAQYILIRSASIKAEDIAAAPHLKAMQSRESALTGSTRPPARLVTSKS
jgi:hypothetical protein